MERLEDRESIKELKARYFRLMDTQDWAPWAGLFTPDAEMQTTPTEGERFVGRVEIVEKVSGVLTGCTTAHHGHMPEIAFSGEHAATGIWAMFDFVDMPQLVLRGFGHYHDRYRREDGVWRIAETRLTRLHLDITPK